MTMILTQPAILAGLVCDLLEAIPWLFAEFFKHFGSEIISRLKGKRGNECNFSHSYYNMADADTQAGRTADNERAKIQYLPPQEQSSFTSTFGLISLAVIYLSAKQPQAQSGLR